MKDITKREDVEILVNKFYDKVIKDDLIGFFFTDIAKIDLSKHLPKMYIILFLTNIQKLTLILFFVF